MADPIKRLHYFNHQFLRAEDFTTEQEYHLNMRRQHNRLLHTWGIAEGLEVPDPPAGSTAVRITAGVAIDSQGHEIVLSGEYNLELESFDADASVYVSLEYDEEQSDPTEETGVEGNQRWKEDPRITVSETKPVDPGLQLILAQVNRSGTEVSGIDLSERKSAGVVAGDLEVRSLTLTAPNVVSDQWANMRLGAANRADIQGNVQISGNLVVDGSIQGDLAATTVETTDIVNRGVTEPKLANNAVSNRTLQNDGVTSNKLAEADGTTGQNTGSGRGVKTAHLQNGAVTNEKVATRNIRHSNLNLDGGTNPHGTTAANVGALVSVEGVSNPGGNIDLLPANAITVSGSNAANRITIGETHSGITGNPHGTTAAQVGALSTTGGTLSNNLQVNGSTGLGISASSTYRLRISESGTSTGTKQGLYCTTTGNGHKYAGQFHATTDSGTYQTKALYGYANTSGTGLTQGLDVTATGTGTGEKRGVYSTASGAGTKTAGYFNASSGTGSDYTRAVYANASSSGTNTVRSLEAIASGSGTGQKYGVYAQTSGPGHKYGGYYYSTTTSGSYQTMGSYNQANNNGTGNTYGVYAYAGGTGTGPKYGIFSSASGSGTRYAGYFSGNVHVSGSLTKSSGSFLIDHPQDPYNKTLRHDFVESPEALCLYRGKVKLDKDGQAKVRMPDYFASLTKEEDATVTLTPIGKKPFMASYDWDKKFTAFTVYGDPERQVSYIVLADRDDPAMNFARRPVEEDKGDGNFEKDQLINPEAYGKEPTEMVAAEKMLAENQAEESRRSDQELKKVAKELEAEEKEQKKILAELAGEEKERQKLNKAVEQQEAELKKILTEAGKGAGKKK